jgi:hypothetical protein
MIYLVDYFFNYFVFNIILGSSTNVLIIVEWLSFFFLPIYPLFISKLKFGEGLLVVFFSSSVSLLMTLWPFAIRAESLSYICYLFSIFTSLSYIVDGELPDSND